MNLSHDRLQQNCHIFLRNNYPQHRYCYWAVINGAHPAKGESAAEVGRRGNYLKAIGMEPGVLDYHIYFRGVLHVFDFKVGDDRLSPAQLAYIAQIVAHGGKSYEIRDEATFQQIVNRIFNT